MIPWHRDISQRCEQNIFVNAYSLAIYPVPGIKIIVGYIWSWVFGRYILTGSEAVGMFISIAETVAQLIVEGNSRTFFL